MNDEDFKEWLDKLQYLDAGQMEQLLQTVVTTMIVAYADAKDHAFIMVASFITRALQALKRRSGN